MLVALSLLKLSDHPSALRLTELRYLSLYDRHHTSIVVYSVLAEHIGTNDSWCRQDYL
jgi:hypothetical protein